MSQPFSEGGQGREKGPMTFAEGKHRNGGVVASRRPEDNSSIRTIHFQQVREIREGGG